MLDSNHAGGSPWSPRMWPHPQDKDYARGHALLSLPLGGPRADSKEGRRQLAYLLQDELLILWGDLLAEMHDENIRSCVHSDAGLWLVGVIAYFILGRVLKKLKTERPTSTSYSLMWKDGNRWTGT